jgi:hypothetical protein
VSGYHPPTSWMRMGKASAKTRYMGRLLGRRAPPRDKSCWHGSGSWRFPVRSHYATDSAAMLGKAIRLIDAVRTVEREEQANRSIAHTRNPFGKPWGLQTDGDLWEQAWNAVRMRGAGSQTLRKVKGHATIADIAAGRSTKEDRIGNDRSDTNADKGVQCIHGNGFVVLAGWLA